MISVCIPVYNYRVSELLQVLRKQVVQLKMPVEIIVIDDGSESIFKDFNANHKNLADQYIELPENIGRAAIRNRFVQYAKYAFMLFIDCDCMPGSENYLGRYASILHADSSAVWCGGRIYDKEKPSKQKRLRWTYGKKIESKPSIERARDPYRTFHTNNFIVRRDLLQRFPFDESLRGYGHEDTMFGYVMKQNHIPIVHLDNPVINMHLEDNKRFLDLTDEGLLHLRKISKIPGMSDHVRMLNVYEQMRSDGMDAILFRWLKKPLRYLLEKGFAWMWLLQLYKLVAYRNVD